MRSLMLMIMLLITITSAIVETKAEPITKVRIGWQIPWAIQGQIVQIFKHTDILKKHHIEAVFIGRTYGPELNELAIANEVDVILTADQPAALLFSKDKGWVGFSRLMYNRTSTYVPISSPIKSIDQLKGKTIGLPFGAAAERIIVEALTKQNLKPKVDVHFINLAMPEHMPLVKKSERNTVKFDQFDALSGFDPAPAIMERLGLVRTIHSGKVVALAVTKLSFLKENTGFSKNFRNALIDAYDYYNQHENEANNWFLAEAKMGQLPDQTWDLIKKFEPNLTIKSKKDITVTFSSDDLSVLQSAADFLESNIGKKINMKSFISHEY